MIIWVYCTLFYLPQSLEISNFYWNIFWIQEKEPEDPTNNNNNKSNVVAEKQKSNNEDFTPLPNQESSNENLDEFHYNYS